jgi:hypothetical protein
MELPNIDKYTDISSTITRVCDCGKGSVPLRREFISSCFCLIHNIQYFASPNERCIRCAEEANICPDCGHKKD